MCTFIFQQGVRDKFIIVLDLHVLNIELLLSFFVFSIMNSLVIVLFLSGMVAMIMLRTLHKDIARYNQMDSAVCCFAFFLVLCVDKGLKNTVVLSRYI